ncbi:MAG: radical SAM family heme chaperone HemW [Magnetococcales bacterium]|nr:radical SAM family heme chaperone HemW [Magnetococcales bacterium]MBF0157817.1 radical SAM family heme chaperone HemW [Magnetococcales bacterium]
MPPQLPGLALYVHLPFCVSKCPYCDFSSRVVSPVPEKAYTDTLVEELRLWRNYLQEDRRPLDSVFFGGGTPSLFSPDSIGRLMQGITRLWPLAPGCEVTLEANPESSTLPRFQGYRAAGVTRLSLGIQSLDPQRLHGLQRAHDRNMALAAMEAASKTGFAAVNFDLIYGTPGQGPDSWKHELEEVTAWNPAHLSCYQLTPETGTPLAARIDRGDLSLPAEEEQRKLWDTTWQTLESKGWEGYEISNFARPGQRCRHNDHVWDFGDYLGIGAAAHGKLTREDGTTTRFVNKADPETYKQSVATTRPSTPQAPTQVPAQAETIDRNTNAGDCLMLGLRRREGVNLETFRQAAGGADPLLPRQQWLEELLENGIVEISAERLRLTPRGRPLLDEVTRLLLPGL